MSTTGMPVAVDPGDGPWPLRPSPTDRDHALAHLATLLGQAWTSFDAPRPHQPGVSPDSLALLDMPLPTQGVGSLQTLEEAASILDESLAQSRPRFLGYVGSSGLEIGVMADALAAAHDVNMASVAAAATHLEEQTIQWVSDFVGFGPCTGSITSGGMLSNLTALACARERVAPGTRFTGIRERFSVYCSADAHSSVERAVELLGIGSHSVRQVRLDHHRRMDPANLAEHMAADVAMGYRPLAVVATAGTTLTGAVDPIDDIVDLCRRHGAWLHVDGAYGLPAAATSEAGHLFHGLEKAESASVDAHKWMFVPKACSVFLTRDRRAVFDTFSHDAAYMVDETHNPVEVTLEYSRPFRALKLWSAFRAHGSEAIRAGVAHGLHLAGHLADRVANESHLELLLPPELSIVLFRYRSSDADALNQRIVNQLQSDGDVYVTSAVVDGATVIRPCFTNYRTTTADVNHLVQRVIQLGRELS